MSPVAWVATLLAAGLGVIVLEVFVPSGGILGFVSVTALVAAVVMAFTQLGAVPGMAVLAFTVGAVPAVLALAFRWFPDTPLGRRVLPAPPDPADVLPAAPKRQKLRSLIGRSGLAASELVPWGTVDVDGLVIEAMSESGPIAVGGWWTSWACRGWRRSCARLPPWRRHRRHPPSPALRPPKRLAEACRRRSKPSNSTTSTAPALDWPPPAKESCRRVPGAPSG